MNQRIVLSAILAILLIAGAQALKMNSHKYSHAPSDHKHNHHKSGMFAHKLAKIAHYQDENDMGAWREAHPDAGQAMLSGSPLSESDAASLKAFFLAHVDTFPDIFASSNSQTSACINDNLDDDQKTTLKTYILESFDLTNLFVPDVNPLDQVDLQGFQASVQGDASLSAANDCIDWNNPSSFL